MNATSPSSPLPRSLERLAAGGPTLAVGAGDAAATCLARWDGRGEPPVGPYAAILWWPASGADREELVRTLTLLRSRLAEGGSLAFALPATGVQEALPRPEQEELRSLVAALSETGWCIRRDEPEGDLRVLVARPDDLEIRSYAVGDEDAILALFRTSFHAQRDLAHWRWKYLDGPWGGPYISLARAEGELVCHYGGYLVPVSIADQGQRRELTAMQMGDTMTHPDFRDRGRGRSALLPRTVRHFFSRHRTADTAFYFGFNTGPIQRFCEWFIGGFFAEPVGFWTRPSDGLTALTAGRRYRIAELDSFGSEIDRFFHRCAPAYGTLVRRDAAYLDWRYRRCPDTRFVVLAARRFGRLVGLSVFRRQDERLLWGDSLFAPRHADAAAGLLATAAAHPELAGCSSVEHWSSERPRWWAESLHALGFERRPHPQGLGMVALSNGPPATPERIRELCYTMGDGDLF